MIPASFTCRYGKIASAISLECRGLWLDDGAVQMSLGPGFVTTPLSQFNLIAPPMPEGDVTKAMEVVSDKTQRGWTKYSKEPFRGM